MLRLSRRTLAPIADAPSTGNVPLCLGRSGDGAAHLYMHGSARHFGLQHLARYPSIYRHPLIICGPDPVDRHSGDTAHGIFRSVGPIEFGPWPEANYQAVFEGLVLYRFLHLIALRVYAPSFLGGRDREDVSYFTVYSNHQNAAINQNDEGFRWIHLSLCGSRIFNFSQISQGVLLYVAMHSLGGLHLVLCGLFHDDGDHQFVAQ